MTLPEVSVGFISIVSAGVFVEKFWTFLLAYFRPTLESILKGESLKNSHLDTLYSLYSRVLVSLTMFHRWRSILFTASTTFVANLPA